MAMLKMLTTAGALATSRLGLLLFVLLSAMPAFAVGTSTTVTASAAAATSTATTNVTTSTFCVDSSYTFCVTAVRGSSATTFTVYSKVSGWCAFGTGSSMSGSTMFVGWMSGGSPVVSQRQSSGHSTPSYTSNTVFTKIATPSGITVPSSANCAFSISVPVSNTNIISTTSSSNFIYGISNSGPSNPSSASSNFPQHSSYGAFTLDVSKTGTSTVGASTSTANIDMLLLHSILMFLAWGVFPYVAIFVARYLKNAMGHMWYLTHKYLFLFGVGGAMAVGLLFVELNLADGVARFSSSSHAILGAVLAFGFYPAQIILGFVSNKLFTENRVAVPWWDKAHWWLGRTTVIISLAEIQLGLNKYQDERGLSIYVIVAFWVWIAAVLLLAFGFVGEYSMGGAVHHIAGNGSESGLDSAVSLGDRTGIASIMNRANASRNRSLPVSHPEQSEEPKYESV